MDDVKTVTRELKEGLIFPSESNVSKTVLSSVNSDWRRQKSSKECLLHLCLTETFSDICFAFQRENGKVIPAHKLILAMRSPVFEAMFYGPMASDFIKIEDVQSSTFSDVLRYLYTDTIHLTGENVLECLYTAKKYQLEGLAIRCSDFLATALSVDNVCDLFNQAILFDEKQLANQCLTFVCENTSDVFLHSSFSKLRHDCLTAILQSDQLSVDDEIDVFKAAVRWAKTECQRRGCLANGTNMRSYLGDAFYLIRLPTIKPQAFTEVVVQSGLLTTEEENGLYRCLTSNRNTSKFLSQPRIGCEVEIVFTGETVELSRKETKIMRRYGTKGIHRKGLNAYLAICCRKKVRLTKVLFDHKVTGTLSIQYADISDDHFEDFAEEGFNYEPYYHPKTMGPGRGSSLTRAFVSNNAAVFDNGPVFESKSSYAVQIMMNDVVSQRLPNRVRISVAAQSNRFGISLKGTSTFISALIFAACQ